MAMKNGVGKRVLPPASEITRQQPQASPETMFVGGATQKQVTGTFGHQGGGKAYNWLAPANVRAGQVITAPVTHPVSGKNYNTLIKVQATSGALQPQAVNRAEHLASKGILLKTAGQSSQTTLPGYYKGWGKDAKAAYDLKVEERLKTGAIQQAWDSETGKFGNYKSQALRDKEREIDQLRYAGVKFKNANNWDYKQKARYTRMKKGGLYDGGSSEE